MPEPALLCDDYLALPRAPEAWIIEDVLPASGLCLIYGGPKLGKSYLTLQMMAAVASGARDWLGFRIKTPGPALYVQLDTPRPLWAQRIEDLKTVHLPAVRRIHIADRQRAPDGFDILETRCSTWLTDQVRTITPVVTALDTIREFHRGSENESDQMMKVIGAVQDCTTPSAVVLVAHDRKTYEKASKSLMESMRGSNYVAGRMDTIMRLSRDYLTYQGRTCEETKLALVRHPESQLWSIEVPAIELHLPGVLVDPNFRSVHAQAKELARLTGLSVSTCSRAIKREMGDPDAPTH